MKKDREKKQKYSNITDATIMGSTAEENMLYASANREHFSVLDRLEEISISTNRRGILLKSKSKPMLMRIISLQKKGKGYGSMMIFLAGKRLRLRIFAQTMPRPRRTTKSWIMSVWMKRGMSFLERSRKVNLWAEMVKSVLKNSYLKTMKNIGKMA